MTKVNDGGAAFPQISELGDIAATSGGMTLRDWFAGQALASFNTHRQTASFEARDMAISAYEIADAMLAARGSA